MDMAAADMPVAAIFRIYEYRQLRKPYFVRIVYTTETIYMPSECII